MGEGRLGPASAAVFLASAVVLALQIAFIRALSFDTYHHFTYLVISTALLGFGASGTVLTVAWRRIERRPAFWSTAALVLLVVTSALAYRVAVGLRPDMQYVLFSLREVLKLWAHALVLFVPFFAGGAFVGMALAFFRGRVGLVYGANMVGSGLGGVSGVLLAFVVGPYRMPAVIALLGVAALFSWLWSFDMLRSRSGRRTAVIAVAVSLAAVVPALTAPVRTSIDQYKSMAHALRLAEQGDAEHLEQAIGPREQIDIFDIPSEHHTLFASPTAPAPPRQLSLYLDGDHAGGVFLIDEVEEAEVMRHTAQALAYRLVSEPEVLLLGERTGVNVWLALAHGARRVTVVQPNPQLPRAIAAGIGADGAPAFESAEPEGSEGPEGPEEPPASSSQAGAQVFAHPAVRVVNAEPRLFLERTGESFDIIHFAEAEGMPAGAGGLASMGEDYMLTVEAVEAALRRLTDGGYLTATRGMQSPPRDNVRLFALFAEALRTAGAEPAEHLVQARNYLAVTTLASADPMKPEGVARVRELAAELSADVDYHPGITEDDLTERNRVSGPEGAKGSWYYHAAQRILGDEGRREAFFRDWVYDLRPPTDDRPYFHSFFRFSSLPRYIRSYGQYWFQRLELGYAVVLVTFVQVVLAALVLILAPIVVLRRRRGRRAGGKAGGKAGGRAPPLEEPGGAGLRRPIGWTVVHFTAIGLGFLLLEMLHIQRFTRFLGDPIYATAAVLTAILVFSGAGSAAQGLIARRPRLRSAGERIRTAGVAVAVLAMVYYLALDPVLQLGVGAGEPVRFVITLLLLLPISFMMGWLMPAGLEIAAGGSSELVPLAWAINGVASVAATPLSVMIAAGGGFLTVSAVAAACYAVAAIAVMREQK